MQAVEELMLKMADDALIMGHRNSEWTGLGPILEEDIALSSMAQDKVGHALALYNLLHEHFGAEAPDTLAFGRDATAFRCCHLVEFPIGEYDFTIVRHFLFDHAEMLRYQLLTRSSFVPLAQLAKKIHGELKYHLLHADTWLMRLATGSAESHARMQHMLDKLFPLAFGIFEPGKFEQQLQDEKIFAGEAALQSLWLERIAAQTEAAHLLLPAVTDAFEGYGGRSGYHTDYLPALLNEMCSVMQLEKGVEW